MNTKLTLAAFAMFAVLLGLSAIAPAMAKPGNPTSNATFEICHYAEEEIIEIDLNGDGIISDDEIFVEEAHWMFLFVSGNGALNGHIDNHGDGVDFDFEIVDDVARDRCNALVGPEE